MGPIRTKNICRIKSRGRFFKRKETGFGFKWRHGFGGFAKGNGEPRKEAKLFCENLCSKFEIPFQTKTSNKELTTEAEMREFRIQSINEIKAFFNADITVFAHHQNDLFETRLLRLIRGTGAQGLSAMHYFKNNVLRPLLGISKNELSEYLTNHDQIYIHDPSNEESDYMRNWIRNHWLASLEKHAQGSSYRLAMSLENIVQTLNSLDDVRTTPDLWIDSSSVNLAVYWGQSRWEQRQILAQILLNLNIRDFTRGQIEEVQKNLDTCPNVHTFRCAGLHWQINAGRLKALI
jgi:tRNA(Ile)-lysidine synthase